MGQRVNIQYSVELEDLQDEVNRLFSNAITQMASLPHASLNLGTDGLDKVDNFRQKLAKVDVMLGDIQNIIEGYVRFKTPPLPDREIPFQEVSDNLETEQLEDRITKFKEMLNEIADQEPQEENKLNIKN
tara:strand:+ start:786 stop:1175 length:390 start_codon:yes stop_codon:yes gene_type:complete